MDDLVLVCSRGFADVLPLARQNRADPYAAHVPASPWLSLLPRDRRLEVDGRIDAQGREVEPLNAEAVIAQLRAREVAPRVVAISLLFSPRNPAHELALEAALTQAFPGLRVACAHRIDCEGAEYERTLALMASLGIMPAQPADEPAPPRAPSQAWHAALEHIADRMQQRLVEQAVSSVVREAMDCAAAIFLPDGQLIAQARTLPLLLGSLQPAVQGLLAAFPAETLAPGDGYLSNDPWAGGTHLPDLVLMRPVFVEGRLRALVACVLHHQDVGGIAPGSVPTHATSIQQEGLRIPPARLFHAEQVDARLLHLIAANSRMPDNLRGDLQAQWQGLLRGEAELMPWIAAQGMDFERQAHAALQASEAAVRRALAAAPDGSYRFEDALDGDGVTTDPVRLVVRIDKRGDAAVLDLSDCATQTPGPVNASRGAVWAAVSYFARMLAPEAASNGGCTVPFTLRTREATIVDPVFPAAVNARTNLVKLLANAFLGAWAQARPEAMPAPNAAEVVVLSLGGEREGGARWLFTEIIASAAGGAPWGPGGSGVSTDVGNARSTPAEVIESQAPLRVERVALRVGSGGAGRHAGGDGVVRVYRLLAGSGSISYRGERHGIAPQGAAGGRAGACASARIERADGRVEVLPAKARAHWQAGDRLVIETAGAGGWGHPAEDAGRG